MRRDFIAPYREAMGKYPGGGLLYSHIFGVDVPPCSGASMDATLYAIDPPSARRRCGSCRDAGRVPL